MITIGFFDPPWVSFGSTFGFFLIQDQRVLFSRFSFLVSRVALSKLVSAMSASDLEWFLVSGFSFLAEVCLHFLVSRFWFLVSSLRGVCGFWGVSGWFVVSRFSCLAGLCLHFLVSRFWFLLAGFFSPWLVWFPAGFSFPVSRFWAGFF